MFYKREG